MASKKGYDVRKTVISTTGLVVLLAILVLVNVIFSYANIRWDATEDRIYSVSEGTQRILEKMIEPVTIKFFFSRSNQNLSPGMKLFGKRVREFLSEYEHGSKGKVKVEVYDPKPDSDEEEWAQKYGLRPVGGGGEAVYAGLVFLAADREARIEFLDPNREELLEYDITRIIHGLQKVERKRIGVLSSLPVFSQSQNPAFPGQGGGRPWFFITELKKSFDVVSVPLDSKRIDPDNDLLLIIHPQDWDEQLEYAIDQYILGGGKAIVFVDPVALSERRRQQFQPPKGSQLKKLFKAWGIEMNPGKAVADLELATRLRAGNKVEENPVWLSPQGQAFSRSEVITAKLERMLLPIAGALRKSGDSSYEVLPLIQSSSNSALVDAFVASFGSDTIRTEITPGSERLTLALRVQGKFQSAFPGGSPSSKGAEGENQAATQPHIAQADSPASVIIVADADLLADEFYVRRTNFLGFNMASVFNDNFNFLANACELLTGSDELIGLRSRAKFERPFTRVQELKRQAQERWLAKEKELVQRAEETNRRLRELEKGKDSTQRTILSPEQEEEIAKFRRRRLQINHQLKEVRKNLRADIENLGMWLKALNILLMPLLVSMAGLLFAFIRQRRVKRS